MKRHLALIALALLFNGFSWAQSAKPGAATANAANSAGARFIESCQRASERGEAPLGCQGPLYSNEIARLKDEALRTRNAGLLTLLGDAHLSNRSAVSDIGEAYRWYLMAAVRGDPRAMQRLSELYDAGRGAPRDEVKALGYARLSQLLATPGSVTARQVDKAVRKLGAEMALEEWLLAERFAVDFERQLQKTGAAPVREFDDTAVESASAPPTRAVVAQPKPKQEQVPKQAPEPAPEPAPVPPSPMTPLVPRMPGMGAVPVVPAQPVLPTEKEY